MGDGVRGLYTAKCLKGEKNKQNIKQSSDRNRKKKKSSSEVGQRLNDRRKKERRKDTAYLFSRS